MDISIYFKILFKKNKMEKRVGWNSTLTMLDIIS